MFWNLLTQAEQDEYYGLMKKMDAWVKYCEGCRNNRGPDKKKRPLPVDFSLDLEYEEYRRHDELATKFWTLSSEAERPALNR